MHLVANAVARLAYEHAVPERDRLDICVVVGVLEARLQHVMIDVRDRSLGHCFIDAERFELKIAHRARRVLRQRLVDRNNDGRARYKLALDQMLGK